MGVVIHHKKFGECRHASSSVPDFSELHRIPGIGGRRDERCFHNLVMGPMADASSSPVANTFVVSSAASQ